MRVVGRKVLCVRVVGRKVLCEGVGRKVLCEGCREEGVV